MEWIFRYFKNLSIFLPKAIVELVTVMRIRRLSLLSARGPVYKTPELGPLKLNRRPGRL